MATFSWTGFESIITVSFWLICPLIQEPIADLLKLAAIFHDKIQINITIKKSVTAHLIQVEAAGNQ